MCGIVGLFLKDKSLEPKLGALLSEMLVSLSDRGPDSAGIAIYGSAGTRRARSPSSRPIRSAISKASARNSATSLGAKVDVIVKSTHAVIEVPSAKLDEAREAIVALRPAVRVMGAGEVIEIYKEVGLPGRRRRPFRPDEMTGTHGIGHTRMATESAVTTLGAHPFSTGPDQCLVHNGSLSNHNNVRRELIREGMTFETENDTEVAAAYLSSKMAHGMNLGEALEADSRPTSTASSPSSSAPRTASAWCAIRSPASRRCWPRPTVRRLRLGIPGACQPARHRGRQDLGAGAGQSLFLGALNADRRSRQRPRCATSTMRCITSRRAPTRPPGR